MKIRHIFDKIIVKKEPMLQIENNSNVEEEIPFANLTITNHPIRNVEEVTNVRAKSRKPIPKSRKPMKYVPEIEHNRSFSLHQRLDDIRKNDPIIPETKNAFFIKRNLKRSLKRKHSESNQATVRNTKRRKVENNDILDLLQPVVERSSSTQKRKHDISSSAIRKKQKQMFDNNIKIKCIVRRSF